MTYSYSVVKKITLFFFFSWIFIGLVLFGTFGSLKIASVWFLVSLPFYPLFIFGYLTKHLTLNFFIIGVFIAHGLGSPLFFTYEGRLSPTGWTAVGDFDFSLSYYLQIYLYVFLFFYFVLCSIFLIQHFFKAKLLYKDFVQKNEKLSHGGIKYDFLIISILFGCTFLNLWMFENGVGMTGIQPPRLPYRLSGILYFCTRFLIPIVIIYFYAKSSKKMYLSMGVLLFALFAALTQVSRTTLTMYFLPVLFFSLIDRKYFVLTISIILFFVFFPVIEVARGYVYLVSDNVVSFNSKNSFLDIIKLIFESGGPQDTVVQSVIGFVGRLGGTQDVVLAYQYDNTFLGNSWLEFVRVFFYGDKPDTLHVQSQMYGFVPPEGFSTGDGALSASILVIANKNIFVLFLASFWIAVLLHLHEMIMSLIPANIQYKQILFFLALLFNAILIPRLSLAWLYGYLIIIFFLIVSYKVFLLLFKKK